MRELWMQSPPDIFTGAARWPELIRACRAAVDRHSWGELGNGGLHALMAGRHTPAELSRIGSPMLVLVGEHDMPAFLRAGHLIARDVPGAALRRLEGAGHLCLLEAPDQAARLLARYWATHGP
jgi:2-succinyl-6-hydroxy-2,4-cyclohexadiene-1-carboxylate synthase